MRLVMITCALLSSSALAQQLDATLPSQEAGRTDLELRFNALRYSESKTTFDYGNGTVEEEVDSERIALIPGLKFGAYSGDFLLHLGFAAAEEESGMVEVGYQFLPGTYLTFTN